MIKQLATLMIIGVIMCLFWDLLEIIFYGEIQPRVVDNIIGAILMTSLYYNVEHCINE